MIVIYLWVGASVFMFLMLLDIALTPPTTVSDAVLLLALWVVVSIFAWLSVWFFLADFIGRLLGPWWNRIKDKQLIKARQK